MMPYISSYQTTALLPCIVILLHLNKTSGTVQMEQSTEVTFSWCSLQNKQTKKAECNAEDKPAIVTQVCFPLSISKQKCNILFCEYNINGHDQLFRLPCVVICHHVHMLHAYCCLL